MWQFWVRFIIFIGLWSLITLTQQTENGFSISLILLALSLICFFFLSKKNPSFYIFLLLIGIVMAHALILGDTYFTALLLFFVLILASSRLRQKQFYLLAGLSLVFIVSVFWQNNIYMLAWLALFTACVYLLVHLAQKWNRKKESQQLYETLLAEYRQLKRMHTSKEEIAKAEERTRIAREIHDSVGHRLTALMMKVEMLYLETEQEKLVELKDLANESLEETRAAVKTLESTETHGLAAIVQLIRKLEAESQLLIQFTIKEGVLSVTHSNEQGVTLYRVIQEALTNVMRHSESKAVQIEIGQAPVDGIAFMVKNPYTNSTPYEEGFGIRNMRQRVEEVHGKLSVYPTDKHFVLEGIIPRLKEGYGDVSINDR